jgi:hypothetical protein
MANTTEQLALLTRRIDGLQSAITGLRPHPGILAAVGPVIHWGCKVTDGGDDDDLVLALEALATGDDANHNPLYDPLAPFPPPYAALYGNIATTIGGAFYAPDLAATMDAAPGTGLGRYDIAYIAAGPTGPVFGVVTGTPSTGVKEDYDLNGLKTTPYDSVYDAALPVGAMPVARIYIQGDETGIGNARIADLRNFEGRLKGDPFSWDDMTQEQKDEIIDPAVADATAAVLADNEAFKRTMRTMYWLGI